MAIEKWKTLESKIIFKHPRLSLAEDTVSLPNGKKTKYLRYEGGSNAATAMAMRDNGDILLQRELSYPTGEILYQFAGGGVPEGEDMAKGANRELMEECGLRGETTLLGSYYMDNRRSSKKMYVFIVRNLKESTLAGDEEEFIEYDWYSQKQIDDFISKGEIKNVHTLAAWMLFKNWQSRNSQ